MLRWKWHMMSLRPDRDIWENWIPQHSYPCLWGQRIRRNTSKGACDKDRWKYLERLGKGVREFLPQWCIGHVANYIPFQVLAKPMIRSYCNALGMWHHCLRIRADQRKTWLVSCPWRWWIWSAKYGLVLRDQRWRLCPGQSTIKAGPTQRAWERDMFLALIVESRDWNKTTTGYG